MRDDTLNKDLKSCASLEEARKVNRLKPVGEAAGREHELSLLITVTAGHGSGWFHERLYIGSEAAKLILPDGSVSSIQLVIEIIGQVDGAATSSVLRPQASHLPLVANTGRELVEVMELYDLSHFDEDGAYLPAQLIEALVNRTTLSTDSNHLQSTYAVHIPSLTVADEMVKMQSASQHILDELAAHPRLASGHAWMYQVAAMLMQEELSGSSGIGASGCSLLSGVCKRPADKLALQDALTKHCQLGYGRDTHDLLRSLWTVLDAYCIPDGNPIRFCANMLDKTQFPDGWSAMNYLLGLKLSGTNSERLSLISSLVDDLSTGQFNTGLRLMAAHLPPATIKVFGPLLSGDKFGS